MTEWTFGFLESDCLSLLIVECVLLEPLSLVRLCLCIFGCCILCEFPPLFILSWGEG